jgi:hypothetical protein
MVISAPMFAIVHSPAGNEKGPQHVEHVLADVIQANTRRAPLSLLCASQASEAALALELPASLLTPAANSFAAHYPGAGLTAPADQSQRYGRRWAAHLRLVPDVRQLRTWHDFEDQLNRTRTEPISGLLAAVADRGDGLHASIRFSLEPTSQRLRRRARRVASQLASPLWNVVPSLADTFAMLANGSALERALATPLALLLRKGELPRDAAAKLDEHLCRVVITLSVEGPEDKARLARKRLAALAAAFAPFTAPGRVTFQLCRRPRRSLLSIAELATLWHLPVSSAQTVSMRTTPLPYLPAPVELADLSGEEGSVPLGLTAVGAKRLAAIRAADRLHELVIGKSGMGKSTLLHTQIAADCRHAGVGVVDPHGDLVDDVLTTIPKSRTNDVLILDPADPTGLTVNPLACADASQRALVAENNLAALSKVFGFDPQTAPRLVHILRYTLLALVGTEHASYLSIRPMLTDRQFRKRVVDQVDDEEVRSFWIDEVGRWTERYEQEAMPAILNKTGQFTAHPGLRRLFRDVRGAVNLREAMDAGKIVLVRLSQGKIGEPAARFAGSVVMAGFQSAAMTRADTERTERRPFYLYADEYATFVNASFADTLAQARKYGLYLTAAQQIVSQVDEAIMDAMFGNLATLVTFQVSQRDAERLAAELAQGATPEDLMRLPKYHAVVRTAINGVPSRPFVVRTLPPPQVKRGHAQPETIRRVLARRCPRSRQVAA